MTKQVDISPLENADEFYFLWALFNKGSARHAVKIEDIGREMQRLMQIRDISVNLKLNTTLSPRPERSLHALVPAIHINTLAVIADSLIAQKHIELFSQRDRAFKLSQSGSQTLTRIFLNNAMKALEYINPEQPRHGR